MNKQITALQNKLNDEIPITKAMGVMVKEITPCSVLVSAPLSNNINHKSTAFGGSLYSLAVLAGWSLVYTLLNTRGMHGHIVIQESQIKYRKPVSSEIQARCVTESDEQINKFISTYQRRGMARITLETEVLGEAGVAVIFKGKYVVHQ